jgi:hypothetical protein
MTTSTTTTPTNDEGQLQGYEPCEEATHPSNDTETEMETESDEIVPLEEVKQQATQVFNFF